MPETRRPIIFDPLADRNSNIDRIWAGQSSNSDRKFSNYYDYYFSGEDIKVYIDGLFGPENELDIAAFAYSVRQEKQPLYGFWSYNYDTVMIGSRIISGEITLFTRYPKRMTDLLEEAARARATAPGERAPKNSIVSRLYSNNSQILGSTQDEKNIQKYWSYSQLDRVTSDPALENVSNKNIFSAHPPFNFVILYGVEEVALTPFAAMQTPDVNVSSNLDRMIYSDVNERMIKVDNVSSPMKIILQEVQLINMSTSYSPGGQPIAESYQFIARDYYFTEADLSFIKRLSTSVASDETSPSQSRTSSTTTTQNANAQPNSNIPIYPGFVIKYGDNSSYVRTIQSRLGVSPVDGQFGSTTLSAVTAYQTAQGLNPDGLVGPLTWGSLFN